MVFSEVFGQGVLPAVEREPGVGDTVRHPSADAAEVGMARQIVLQLVETQGDVRHFALAVRNMHLGKNRPVVGDSGLEALAVGQGVKKRRGFAYLPPLHPLQSDRFLLVTGPAGFRRAATQSPGQKAHGQQGRRNLSVGSRHGFLRRIDGWLPSMGRIGLRQGIAPIAEKRAGPAAAPSWMRIRNPYPQTPAESRPRIPWSPPPGLAHSLRPPGSDSGPSARGPWRAGGLHHR